MVFTNPWGLISLISLPAIVALHYFRSHRRKVRVGGLFLWEMSRTKIPVGGKFRRIVSSLPLFLELAAALLLSLIIAGLDFPSTKISAVYTVIVDDSASMNAADDSTAKERAIKVVENLSSNSSLLTIISCGESPHILAGPFAKPSEALASLEEWQPLSPQINLGAAYQLASKFAHPEEKILFITDDEHLGMRYNKELLIKSIGSSASNIGITFADRFRLDHNTDRVFAVIRNFSDHESKTTLSIIVEGRILSTREIILPAREGARYEFDVSALNKEVIIEIGKDACKSQKIRIKPVHHFVNASLSLWGELTKGALMMMPLIDCFQQTSFQ